MQKRNSTGGQKLNELSGCWLLMREKYVISVDWLWEVTVEELISKLWMSSFRIIYSWWVSLKLGVRGGTRRPSVPSIKLPLLHSHTPPPPSLSFEKVTWYFSSSLNMDFCGPGYATKFHVIYLELPTICWVYPFSENILQAFLKTFIVWISKILICSTHPTCWVFFFSSCNQEVRIDTLH